MLPESVLLRAAAEMLDYEGSGQSVMEMSHRSKVYDAIIKGAESLLREVMEIPDNYKVLFLQGRRILAVCDGAAEFNDEKPQGRLCTLRPVLHKSV